jgi:hypothetical protein
VRGKKKRSSCNGEDASVTTFESCSDDDTSGSEVNELELSW